MTELIKLINKDFFPNLKTTLTEASGLNVNNPLPDSNDENTLKSLESVDDETWNTLFKKYLTPGNIKYYIISVDGFERKTPITGEPTQGFIKYVGETEREKSVGWKGLGHGFLGLGIGRKIKDSLNSKDIEIVKQETEATVFPEGDVDSVIEGIKRNRDFKLRGTQFKKQVAKGPNLDATSLSNRILTIYFNKLCDNDHAGDKLRPCLGELNSICRRRNSPLVGNPLMDVLGAIFKANPNFNFSPVSIVTLNDLMANRVVEPEDIINPNSIKWSLLYNNNTYNLSSREIQDLFKTYDEARRIEGNFTLPALADLNNKDGKIKVAKNLLFKYDKDKDPFMAILKGEDVKLADIGYKPTDRFILDHQVRKPTEMKEVLNKLLSTNKVKEEDKDFRYYLYVGSQDYLLRDVDQEDDAITGTFKNVVLKTNEEVKVVKSLNGENLLSSLITANPGAFDKNIFEIKEGKVLVKTDHKTNIDVSIDISTAAEVVTSFKLTEESTSTEAPEAEEPETSETEAEEATTTEGVPEGYEEIDPDGTTVGDQQQDVTVQVGDKVVGLDGNRMDVTAENIGAGKWNIKAGTKIWRLKPEPTPEAEPTSTSGEAFVGGKTLDDILKMTKDEFKTFSLGLTPEDKAKLKAFGGKLLAAK